jgi:predicted molibdopterin-dependent oxidoreductase YjgC
VLPAASYIEQNGTYTACDRRIQKVNRIFDPRGGYQNWEIIKMIFNGFGNKLSYKSSEDIFDEIQLANRFYEGCEIGGFWGRDLFKDRFFTLDRKAHFSISDSKVAAQGLEHSESLFSENYFSAKIKRYLML